MSIPVLGFFEWKKGLAIDLETRWAVGFNFIAFFELLIFCGKLYGQHQAKIANLDKDCVIYDVAIAVRNNGEDIDATYCVLKEIHP